MCGEGVGGGGGRGGGKILRRRSRFNDEVDEIEKWTSRQRKSGSKVIISIIIIKGKI